MKKSRDQKVDAYIERSAEFARPVLRHLRKLVHQACPEATEEIKWSMPFFLYHGIFCYMAAFKQHCGFGFRGQDMAALLKKEGHRVTDSMGSLGRITSLEDLPSDETLLRYIRTAAKLNEAGTPARPRRTKPKAAAKVPADLVAALCKNKKAATTFEKFSPSQQREYIEWITGAKQPETRAKRLATTMEWLAEGKPRHWKYQKR
jgi:uncharacterized protein YdeI (YjbR/CyaY-like superfamily)